MSRNVRDDPPFFVVPYVDNCRDPLDARRFTAIRPSGDAKNVLKERHGGESDTAWVLARNVGVIGAAAARYN